jgi:plastocyanin
LSRSWARQGEPLRKILSITALATICLVAAACSGASEPTGPTPTPAPPTDGELTVTAFEWGFGPEGIVLQSEEEVQITFQNDGDIIHNLTVDDLEIDLIEDMSSGGFSADEGELLVGAASEDVGTITFVPLEPGEYTFFCSIANHRQLGMEGRLIVE